MTKQKRIILLFLLFLVGMTPVMATDYLLNIDANSKGKVQVYKMNGVELSNQESVTSGEKYRVVATCEDDNYLFDFIEVEGGRSIVIEDKEKGISTFVVSGSGSVTVKAVFIGKPQTLTLKALDVEQGIYKVICNGKNIQSGGTVPYGSAITVFAEPKEGYVVESVRVNEEIIAFTDNKVETVAVADLSLEVLFTKIEFVTVVCPKKMPSLMTMTVLLNGEIVNSNDKIPFGSKVDIKITDKWGYNFYFWINGIENTLEKINNQEYQCVINAKEDLNIAITQAGAVIGITACVPVSVCTYDGSPKKYSGYRLIPDGISNVDVVIKYRLSGTKDTLDTPPVEVGVYDVFLNREKDEQFRALTKTVLKALIIEKKKVEISQLPVIANGELTGGIAKAGDKQIKGSFQMKTIPDDGNIVSVEFVPEDVLHYTTAACQISAHNEVKKFQVRKAAFTDGVSFNILNGDYVLNEGEEVAEGTSLNIQINALPKGKKVERWLNQIDNITAETVEIPFLLDKPLCLTANTTGAEKLPEIELMSTKIRQEKSYTGGECPFSTLLLGKFNGKYTDTDEWIVNYTAKSSGKKVLVPFASGEYVVSLSCPSNDKHEAFAGEGVLVVTKSKPENVDFASLRYTPVATGQPLKYAALSEGVASLPGTFTWKDSELAAFDGRSYEILFTPKDTNFQTVSGAMIVNTRFTPYLLVDEIENGSVTVLNKTTGKVLKSGDWMQVGDELSITAIPNSGYVLQKVTVNDYTIVNGSFYIVGDQKIVVSATFKTAYLVTRAVDALGTINIESDDTDARNNIYTYGTELKLTALPVEGVHFQSWWDGNIENPRTYTVKCDQEISANFRGTPTDMDAVAKTMDIRSAGNNLYMQTDATCKARIIDMRGRMIDQFIVSGFVSYRISQPGVYIVILYKDNLPVLKKKINIQEGQ